MGGGGGEDHPAPSAPDSSHQWRGRSHRQDDRGVHGLLQENAGVFYTNHSFNNNKFIFSIQEYAAQVAN